MSWYDLELFKKIVNSANLKNATECEITINTVFKYICYLSDEEIDLLINSGGLRYICEKLFTNSLIYLVIDKYYDFQFILPEKIVKEIEKEILRCIQLINKRSLIKIIKIYENSDVNKKLDYKIYKQPLLHVLTPVNILESNPIIKSVYVKYRIREDLKK